MNIQENIKLNFISAKITRQFRFKEKLTKEEKKIAVSIGWCDSFALNHYAIEYADVGSQNTVTSAYHMESLSPLKHKYESVLLVKIGNDYCWVPFTEDFKKNNSLKQIFIEN